MRHFFDLTLVNRDFSHQPSTFTDVLNSENIAEPIVPKGTEYFEALLYTGNGGTQSITGLSFSP